MSNAIHKSLFTLSLSKGCGLRQARDRRLRQASFYKLSPGGFDKLSPNGICAVSPVILPCG